MDPELKKGFQELQSQVLESRSKIANIKACQMITSQDAEVNEKLLKQFEDSSRPIEEKFFYQPVGRMLVRREGEEALSFLNNRKNNFKGLLKQYQEVKEICENRVKESENSLRELVNKKLNKPQQQSAHEGDKSEPKKAAEKQQDQEGPKEVKENKN